MINRQDTFLQFVKNVAIALNLYDEENPVDPEILKRALLFRYNDQLPPYVDPTSCNACGPEPCPMHHFHSDDTAMEKVILETSVHIKQKVTGRGIWVTR